MTNGPYQSNIKTMRIKMFQRELNCIECLDVRDKRECFPNTYIWFHTHKNVNCMLPNLEAFMNIWKSELKIN